DGSVLHLAGRVGLGRDVRDLLQLERALQTDGQTDVPTEVEEERLVEVTLRDLLDRMIPVEERGDLVGQSLDLRQQARDLLLRQRLPYLGELERDQVEERDLGGEGLGCRHADLEPAARVQD